MYKASQKNNFTASTGGNFTLPTYSAGDFLLAIAWSGGATFTGAPSGWTLVASTAGGYLQVWSKVADGTEGATEPFSLTASATCTISAFSFTSANSAQAGTYSYSSTYSTTITPATLVPNELNGTLIGWFDQENGSSTGATTLSGGMTNVIDTIWSATKRLACGYLELTTQNPTPSITATFTNASTNNNMMQVLVYSAPGGQIDESITLDSTFTGSGTASGTITESVALGSIFDSSVTVSGSISESISITDTYTGHIGASNEINETISIADTYTAGGTFDVSIDETLDIAFTFDGAVISSQTYDDVWRILKWDSATSSYIPAAALSPLPIFRVRNSAGLFLDFGVVPNIFKDEASVIEMWKDMPERNAVAADGEYVLSFLSSGYTGKFIADGKCMVTPIYYSELLVLHLRDGIDAMDALPLSAENAAATLAAWVSYKIGEGYSNAEQARINNAILHGTVTGAGVKVGSNYVETFWNLETPPRAVARITSDKDGNRLSVEVLDAS